MTKTQWTTSAQREWLEARIPDFVQAQKDKRTTTTFFPAAYKAWVEEFPISSPSEEKIAKAQGTTVEDKRSSALAVKTKLYEKVGVLLFYNCPNG